MAAKGGPDLDWGLGNGGTDETGTSVERTTRNSGQSLTIVNAMAQRKHPLALEQRGERPRRKVRIQKRRGRLFQRSNLGGEVRSFVPRQRHLRHLGMRIE